MVFGPTSTLAAGYAHGDSGGVVLFDAEGERLQGPTQVVRGGQVASIALGPESHISTGYFQGNLTFHPRADVLQTAVQRVPIWGYRGARSIAFAASGETAVGFSSEDPIIGRVVLFDAEGQLLWPTPLDMKHAPVTSLAFGPAGKLAVGVDDNVLVFDVDPTSWRRKAGHTANRNLMWAEWRLYFPDTPYHRVIKSLPWPDDIPDGERQNAEAIEKEHLEASESR